MCVLVNKTWKMATKNNLNVPPGPITAHHINNRRLYLCLQTSPAAQTDKVNPRVIPRPQSTSCTGGSVLEENTFCQWNGICESAIWTQEQELWSTEPASQPLRGQDLGSDWPEEGGWRWRSEGGGQNRTGQGPLSRCTLDQRPQLIRFCPRSSQAEAPYPSQVTFLLHQEYRKHEAASI